MENKLKFSVNLKPSGYYKCKYILHKAKKGRIDKKVMSHSEDVQQNTVLLIFSMSSNFRENTTAVKDDDNIQVLGVSS